MQTTYICECVGWFVPDGGGGGVRLPVRYHYIPCESTSCCQTRGFTGEAYKKA